MRFHVLINLLNELGEKRLSRFPNEFRKSVIKKSIYYMSQKLDFCNFWNKNHKLWVYSTLK